MADTYRELLYTGLSQPDWDAIKAKYETFAGSGASITGASGRAGDGWFRISAGGPNALGYCTALRAQIKAQIGPEPSLEEDQTWETAKVRTAEDVHEHGNGRD